MSDRLRKASTEEKQKRLDICNACDNTTTTLGKLVCTNCGCVLDWKVALQNQECPIGKW